jgi:Na+:H+ antiporter, NhaA family
MTQTIFNKLAAFFKSNSAGGIIIMLATLCGFVFANSPLKPYYMFLLETPLSISIDQLSISKPLLLWINDGLMTIFFFLIGLELKREIIEGELSDKRNIVLPAVGAMGGMAIPALIYVYFNWHDPIALKGWAIPAATDIAFALAVLNLLGSRVPLAIKLFLTSLAIFDDVGAIIIIALFYTSQISMLSLLIVLVCIPILYLLNKSNPKSSSLFILVGVIMWVAMLKSGVHATLSGVILAMFIPLEANKNSNSSHLKRLESDLHGLVAFFVLPIFVFANSGVSFSGLTIDQFLHSVPLGIMLGLFFGKQLGVFGFCWMAIKLKWAELPKGMNWLALYGTSALCGIGFTMSLFISSLAFDDKVSILFDERLGILLGSLFSGVLGLYILHCALPNKQNEQ